MLRVYAEIGGDGGCLLFTFSPPGLLARGPSLEAALASAPMEAERLRVFLDECGCLDDLEQPWSHDGTPDIVVAETVRRQGRVANGGTRATFTPDLEPVTAGEVARCIALMTHMRETLFALRDTIPSEGYSFRSRPDRMPISEQLRHIAYCECWYLRRFWPDLPRLARTTDVWEKLTQCRGLALSKLTHLTPEDAAAVRKVEGEMWTARKLFRRFLYHETFHRDTVKRDLTVFQRGRQ